MADENQSPPIWFLPQGPCAHRTPYNGYTPPPHCTICGAEVTYTVYRPSEIQGGEPPIDPALLAHPSRMPTTESRATSMLSGTGTLSRSLALSRQVSLLKAAKTTGTAVTPVPSSLSRTNRNKQSTPAVFSGPPKQNALNRALTAIQSMPGPSGSRKPSLESLSKSKPPERLSGALEFKYNIGVISYNKDWKDHLFPHCAGALELWEPKKEALETILTDESEWTSFLERKLLRGTRFDVDSRIRPDLSEYGFYDTNKIEIVKLRFAPKNGEIIPSSLVYLPSDAYNKQQSFEQFLLHYIAPSKAIRGPTRTKPVEFWLLVEWVTETQYYMERPWLHSTPTEADTTDYTTGLEVTPPEALRPVNLEPSTPRQLMPAFSPGSSLLPIASPSPRAVREAEVKIKPKRSRELRSPSPVRPPSQRAPEPKRQASFRELRRSTRKNVSQPDDDSTGAEKLNTTGSEIGSDNESSTKGETGKQE